MSTSNEPVPAPEADFSPAESLALIDAQKRLVGEQIEPDARLLYGSWGLALLVGEGAFFLATWNGSPFDIPLAVAGITLFVTLVSAMVVTSIHIGRRVAGVRGASSRQGMFYGLTWIIGYIALGAVIGGITRTGVDEATVGLMWAAGSGLVIGLLYMAAGAFWLDRTQFFIGAWFALVSGAGAIAGSPWIYLVLSLAGGGGMLVVTAVLFARTRFRGR